MGFLGIKNSNIASIGKKIKRATIGAGKAIRPAMLNTGKVLTTLGKAGQIGGKAGIALTPAVSAFNPAAGLVLGAKSAKLYAAGSVAKVGGRALKKGSKGKIKNFDPARALMRD